MDYKGHNYHSKKRDLQLLDKYKAILKYFFKSFL